MGSPARALLFAALLLAASLPAGAMSAGALSHSGDTEQHLIGARFYDSEQGRFISPDSVLGDLHNPQSLNKYAYVLNNPFAYVDLTGHEERDAQQVRVHESFKSILGTLLLAGHRPTGTNRVSTYVREAQDLAVAVMKQQAEDAKNGGYAFNVTIPPQLLGARGGEEATIGVGGDGEVPAIIYREGKPSAGNLTPRPQDNGELSFRTSLSNPVPSGERPVLRPGERYFGIDTAKLPAGSVVVDNKPPGHAYVKDVPVDVLKGAVVEPGKMPK